MSVGIARLLLVAATLMLMNVPQSSALDAFWHGVRSSDWDHGIDPVTQQSNWYSQAPPNGVATGVPDGEAVFAAGALRMAVEIKFKNEIGAMRFPANTPKYIISIFPDVQFTVTGAGVVNNSTVVPQIRNSGRMIMTRQAKFVGNSARAALVKNQSSLRFTGSSGGGNAEVSNESGTAQTVFFGTSSADSMLITNRATLGRTTTAFADRSTGGSAELINENSGSLEFDATTGPAGDGKVTAGRIRNAGSLVLGKNILTLSGAFNQRTSGQTHIIVRKPAQGRLVVNNIATLDGSLVVNGDTKLLAGRYVILRAAGGRVGKFKTVTFNGFRPGPKPRLIYTPKQIVLSVP